MLVLLPPSEGKAPGPRRGAPVRLDRLSYAGLTPVRAALLDALANLCSGDDERARAVLGLSPGLAGEVARDRVLRTAPAVPVRSLYTGVLYDALGLATLSPAARRRADRSLLVFSGLWGVLRLGDRVPPYRLSGDVSLPGLGPVAALWRGVLDDAVAEAAGRRGLVVDLRSSTYASLWRPTGAMAGRTVTVRVLHERTPGVPASRVVVSHFNKATKGRLVRGLLEAGVDPRDPEALAAALRAQGATVELAAGRAGRPRGLDVVVTEL